MQSFTRKLNRWGFSIIKSGRDKGAYMHRDFVRWEKPHSITKMSKDRKRKKDSSVGEADTFASAKTKKDGANERSSFQRDKVDEDDRKMPPRMKSIYPQDILDTSNNDAFRNSEFGGCSGEAGNFLDALDDRGSQENNDKKLSPRAQVAKTPNYAAAVIQRHINSRLFNQIEVFSTSSASGVQDKGGQTCQRETYANSMDSIPSRQSNDIPSTFSAYFRDSNSDEKTLSAQHLMSFTSMRPRQSDNLFVNECTTASKFNTSEFHTTANDTYSNRAACHDFHGSSSIQTNITAKEPGASDTVNFDPLSFNCDINGGVSSGFCNVLEDDMFSPLAIFPPNSGRDNVHGRFSLIPSAATANVECEKCAKTSVATEDSEVEEMDRDLKEFFSRLEKTIIDEERKRRKG
mmetsp:Transcript_3071/g.6264  ORF Transcript_3071/g.6264 Transcript_3071/m.6264 type:complete len:404 (+) Transcript_3071:51-1262(+)